MIFSLVIIGILGLGLTLFKHKQEVDKDQSQYSMYLEECRMVLKEDMYSNQAIILVNKSDSISKKYKMTRNEYMFEPESRQLKDSLYEIHMKRLNDSFHMYISDTAFKEQTQEYLNAVRMFNKPDAMVNRIERNVNR